MTEKLPIKFDKRGVLPPGDYPMTFNELRSSILVNGPGSHLEPHWDSQWRGRLVDQAETLVKQLWAVGITDVFLDGSFVERKARPNDIDGYFVCNILDFIDGKIEAKLNRLNEHKIWTWDPSSRKVYKGYSKQLPMWHAYRVELYPHFPPVPGGSGIKDENGNELTFPAAYRRTTDGKPKGIVRLIKG